MLNFANCDCFLLQVFDTGNPIFYDRCVAISSNVYSQGKWFYNLNTRCIMAVLRLALHNLYLLPVWCREFVVESGCAVLLAAVLILIHTANQSDGGLTALIIVLVLCVAVIAVYKIYRDIRRELKTFSMLSKQCQIYQTGATDPLPVKIRIGTTKNSNFGGESKQFEIV